MAIKVTLSGTTRGTIKTPVLAGDVLNIPRVVYQKLGSLVANTTLVDDYNAEIIPQEYIRILKELGIYHAEKYYTSTDITEDNIKALDEYLGSLGVTEEYPYSKDSINIGEWLAPGTQSEYRVLMEDDNILMDGDEVLIAYT